MYETRLDTPKFDLADCVELFNYVLQIALGESLPFLSFGIGLADSTVVMEFGTWK